MDWDDLKYFLSISDADTLSAAAEKMGVNQTTVSRRVKRLQDRFGVKLIHHNGTSIVSTAAGESVSEAAREIDNIVSRLHRKLSGLDERLSGSLRITTIEFMAVFETALFKSFKEQYPDVMLDISICDNNSNLLKGNADIALRWTNHPDDHLVGRKLSRAEYALYNNHGNTGRVSMEVLQQQQWLAWGLDNGASVTAAWMKRHVPNAVINCRTNSPITMYHGVKSGLGIGFLPCAYADIDPALHRMRDVEAGFGMDIWVLTHPDLRGIAKVRAFINHAQQYFSQQQRRYAGLMDGLQQKRSRGKKALTVNDD